MRSQTQGEFVHPKAEMPPFRGGESCSRDKAGTRSWTGPLDIRDRWTGAPGDWDLAGNFVGRSPGAHSSLTASGHGNWRRPASAWQLTSLRRAHCPCPSAMIKMARARAVDIAMREYSRASRGATRLKFAGDDESPTCAAWLRRQAQPSYSYGDAVGA
ncbi:uncharacterized protein SCHCODRAFT_02075003 [Schizophyllum commune H4-8]|uniref:uncharacterized protein n=1 Tax=Schizophyllum commune (strain H4-8 / FGSC 9210) TaxID=578458 RepID=UPI0021606D45|nr:uncharacterized protein SCHCODRAFT_02075003 [Schizophyllum commune H4-8]KAI5887915.1 hypothetical protein SCHCODRAFT_02075003 [Schizophyllum commune H4-8]